MIAYVIASIAAAATIAFLIALAVVAIRGESAPRSQNSAWVNARIAEGSSAEVLARAERWEQRRRDAREREARAWAELEQATAEADALKRAPAHLAAARAIRAGEQLTAELLTPPPGYQW